MTSTMIEARSECRNCGRPIYLYVHSQAGPLKATAWTEYNPDDDEQPDPRYGVRCDCSGSFEGWRHVPELDETDDADTF